MGFFDFIHKVGKKIGSGIDSAVKVGHKVAHGVATVGKKISNVAGTVGKGLAIAGGVAGAMGLEPIAGALEVGAGISGAVAGASNLVSNVAGDVDRGINRAEQLKNSAVGVGSALLSGNVASAQRQGIALSKDVQDSVSSAKANVRRTIERGKDVRQQFKSAVGQ